MPVAGNFRDSAISVGGAGARVSGCGIYRVTPCQHHGPVIVIELVWEEVSAGKTVILGAVMAVVQVRGNCMASKTAVLRHINRKFVVMPEQNRFTILRDHQLRRNRAVESPKRAWILIREGWMKPRMDGLRGSDARILRVCNPRIVNIIESGARL